MKFKVGNSIEKEEIRDSNPLELDEEGGAVVLGEWNSVRSLELLVIIGSRGIDNRRT